MRNDKNRGKQMGEQFWAKQQQCVYLFGIMFYVNRASTIVSLSLSVGILKR